MNSLKGKKALVTGGASGIGRAISLELANMGAALIIHYHRSKESAESLAAQINSSGGKAEVVQADLTEEAGVQALTDFVIERWDNLDVLVNNAGDLVGRHKLEEVQMDFYRKVVAVNLDSNVLVTRAMIPLLKKSGSASIVNLASLAGRKGGHGGSIIYSMTKGAILTLTRALSTELAPYGIRVNAVAPGFILGSAFHALHTSEESKQATIRDIPLKRA
ncbi:MAG TPA: SDR family NAD(P)-dependent oxidoreductase, partial [Rectinema sp.]|nr:SDR family NAD(P)-dependent oxidoreductase [Rectinema sp.]